MQHDVEDISPQIHKIYNLVDPIALETMVIEVGLDMLSMSTFAPCHTSFLP